MIEMRGGDPAHADDRLLHDAQPRLKLLKSDEQSLRATISELVTATEIAERAIAGLKITVHECDIGLGARLRSAERLHRRSRPRHRRRQGSDRRLSQIVTRRRRRRSGAQPSPETAEPPRNAQAVAVAAQAFAERLRMKVHGLAA